MVYTAFKLQECKCWKIYSTNINYYSVSIWHKTNSITSNCNKSSREKIAQKWLWIKLTNKMEDWKLELKIFLFPCNIKFQEVGVLVLKALCRKHFFLKCTFMNPDRSNYFTCNRHVGETFSIALLAFLQSRYVLTLTPTGYSLSTLLNAT